MSPSEHSHGELVSLVEELREDNEQLRQENETLRETIEEQADAIATLKAALKRYENAHTPSSQQRSGSSATDGDDSTDDATATDDDSNNNDTRTDGGTGTVGRDTGHEAVWRDLPAIDDVIDVTLECCPDCGHDLDEAEVVHVLARIIEELPEPPPIETTQYNLHRYACEGCGSTVEASHADCPDEGQFGVNVLAQAAYARYCCRLPYRKIADRFEDLLGLELSAASAWHSVDRLARAGREEYETIRDRIRQADVVHADETGMTIDGEQGWLWTFKTDKATLYALRASRGSDVPTEILGEDFEGTLVTDGWSAYPAFTDLFQRCWAHLLREADYVAERHAEADPIAARLHRVYAGLEAFLAGDPTPEQRKAMRERALEHLEAIAATDVESEEVQQLLGKLSGGLGHWLVFVTDPAVAPTNNAAENALREPVVLRKIIGTLRTDSGLFAHETLLSLIATWDQQGLNPYEELKRTARLPMT